MVNSAVSAEQKLIFISILCFKTQICKYKLDFLNLHTKLQTYLLATVINILGIIEKLLATQVWISVFLLQSAWFSYYLILNTTWCQTFECVCDNTLSVYGSQVDTVSWKREQEPHRHPPTHHTSPSHTLALPLSLRRVKLSPLPSLSLDRLSSNNTGLFSHVSLVQWIYFLRLCLGIFRTSYITCRCYISQMNQTTKSIANKNDNVGCLVHP